MPCVLSKDVLPSQYSVLHHERTLWLLYSPHRADALVVVYSFEQKIFAPSLEYARCFSDRRPIASVSLIAGFNVMIIGAQFTRS
jgi:hypothetical protein